VPLARSDTPNVCRWRPASFCTCIWCSHALVSNDPLLNEY
jgi:hypothetical protein